MLFIHGVGHFHPDNVIDNDFLSSLDIGSDSDWILKRVGIHERRTVLDLDYVRKTLNRDTREAVAATQYSNAEMARRASQMALQRAQLSPSQVGLVMGGGCAPEYLIPAEACMTAALLEMAVPAFDLNAGCATFAAQVNFLEQMAEGSMPDYVLLINPESFTKRINYSDRRTAVLFGDAATATIVSKRYPSRACIYKSNYGSDPSGWQKVVIPAAGHFSQEGAAVQGFAVRRTIAVLDELLEPDPATREKIIFIGHQANLTMLQSIVERASLSESRHFHNVDRFGNCGAAGAPSVLSQNWERFREGDELALVVVGSGLSWGGMRIRFSPERR